VANKIPFFFDWLLAIFQGNPSNKELPPFIGEAKVREFDNRKNFER